MKAQELIDVIETDHFANYTLTLNEELTANELGILIEQKLGVKKVGIAGERLAEKIGDVSFKYFECEEVFSFTDELI